MLASVSARKLYHLETGSKASVAETPGQAEQPEGAAEPVKTESILGELADVLEGLGCQPLALKAAVLW